MVIKVRRENRALYKSTQYTILIMRTINFGKNIVLTMFLEGGELQISSVICMKLNTKKEKYYVL